MGFFGKKRVKKQGLPESREDLEHLRKIEHCMNLTGIPLF
jgi:hypothetical protein